MDYIQFFVFFGAFCIGLTLGLIGGGGSILTVPVLVYLMGLDPETATAYSLFVVGVSALVASVKNARRKMIDFRMGLVFAFPAFVVVFVMRKYALPAIPEKILQLGDYTLLKPDALMLFFACVMLLASISMIRGRKDGDEEKSIGYNYPVIFLQGTIVGCITGLVGAGGGFLIIPALVLLARLPVKRAVATSLMIVAINSLCGFLGDVQETAIDWHFLLLFTGVAVIGILIGSIFNSRIDSVKLRKLFGWFVLVMGIYIILKEFL